MSLYSCPFETFIFRLKMSDRLLQTSQELGGGLAFSIFLPLGGDVAIECGTYARLSGEVGVPMLLRALPVTAGSQGSPEQLEWLLLPRCHRKKALSFPGFVDSNTFCSPAWLCE